MEELNRVEWRVMGAGRKSGQTGWVDGEFGEECERRQRDFGWRYRLCEK